MYEAVTNKIRVSVTPTYLHEQSEPADEHYFWAYTIKISNEGDDVVQLLTRYWQIMDATGAVEEVRGPGVVGETPVLEPGDSFEYTSGCPLNTSSGIMRGQYEMQTSDGRRFQVDIPAFSLDLPHAPRIVN